MKNSVMYGIILTSILTGVVIASSEWVFAAPGDDVDYSFVKVNDPFSIVLCPEGDSAGDRLRFQYSEKAVDYSEYVGGDLAYAENTFGLTTSGYVTKDDFVVRGSVVGFPSCAGIPDDLFIIITFVGTCSTGPDFLGAGSFTTNVEGLTGTFDNIVCT